MTKNLCTLNRSLKDVAAQFNVSVNCGVVIKCVTCLSLKLSNGDLVQYPDERPPGNKGTSKPPTLAIEDINSVVKCNISITLGFGIAAATDCSLLC